MKMSNTEERISPYKSGGLIITKQQMIKFEGDRSGNGIAEYRTNHWLRENRHCIINNFHVVGDNIYALTSCTYRNDSLADLLVPNPS